MHPISVNYYNNSCIKVIVNAHRYSGFILVAALQLFDSQNNYIFWKQNIHDLTQYELDHP